MCVSVLSLHVIYILQVVGVDYSGRLIDAAMSIQSGTSVHYLGAVGERKEVKLPEGVDTKRATFKQVRTSIIYSLYLFFVYSVMVLHVMYNSQYTKLQLTWIPNEIEDFDLVLFDFLERLTEPKGWLLKLWECVLSKGLVVITASEKWDKMRIEGYIGKWCVCVRVHVSLSLFLTQTHTHCMHTVFVCC